MKIPALNDEFLRQLRPRPRAAFVHELKARLDRQPRRRETGPAYLRTLLIALLIGGAAFAVTMMSRRHEPLVDAPVSQTGTPPDDGAEVVTSAAASPRDGQLTPAIVHAIRRDSAARAVGIESAPLERQADKPGAAAGDESAVAKGAASQAVTGIAVAGEGVQAIRGGGSAFPAVIYQEWSRQYRSVGGLSVIYDWVGSGGGLKLLQNRAVTFAALDTPMAGAELKASGMFQFPMVVGGVVPIVNLAGVTPSQIRLDGPTLARIYVGDISNWGDPSILKLNPGLALPGTRITVAYRLDASGSTRLFTDYLSRSSLAFNGRYGVKTQIEVSPGTAVRGDDGMADLVGRTDGAIGYVEYRYARQYGVETIRLINKEGKAVSATPESLQSAVAHADWLGTSAFGASLVDLRGENTWPMTGASFIVMQGHANRSQTAEAVEFFDWAYRKGAPAATELGYVTIPPELVNHIRAMWVAALKKGVRPDAQGK